MTPRQRTLVEQRQAQGFSIVEECRTIVRVTRHNDHRVIDAQGVEKRGQPGGHGGRRP